MAVRKMTAYNAFIKKNHPSVKGSILNPTPQRVISELSKRWRSLPANERCKYVAMARNMKVKPKVRKRRPRQC